MEEAPTIHPTTIDTLEAELPRLRRQLHQCPEIGFKELETSEIVRDWLRERGLDVKGPIAETGMFVEIKGDQDGPTVAYRADMDGLPIDEQTGLPFASRNSGRMHACGHDGHMAIACGVAALADAQRDNFPGTLRVILQPSEECTPSGAPRMIEEGILDGVEAAFAIHVDPTRPLGKIGLREGAMTAACVPFSVSIETEASGHSARPHETVDVVWLATQVSQQLYSLAGRVTDARIPVAFAITTMRAGEAKNVMPQVARLGGTLRCPDPHLLTDLQERMDTIVQSLAELHGASASLNFGTTLPGVLNSPDETKRIRALAVEALGSSNVQDIPLPSMGGEDFAYFLERVPGAMIRVGTASGPETSFPLHHARFDLDERALAPAADLMTAVCLNELRVRAENR